MISAFWIFPAMVAGAVIGIFMVAAHDTEDEQEDPEDDIDE